MPLIQECLPQDRLTQRTIHHSLELDAQVLSGHPGEQPDGLQPVQARGERPEESHDSGQRLRLRPEVRRPDGEVQEPDGDQGPRAHPQGVLQAQHDQGEDEAEEEQEHRQLQQRTVQ